MTTKPALLSARNIGVEFGQLQALAGVDLTVNAGTLHGLIGPNGSGKSTLLKSLAGAIVPNVGTIELDGIDVTQARPPERARRGVSLKFQITGILPSLTVYDNVLLALQARDSLLALAFSRTRSLFHEQVIATLQQFKLLDRADDQAGTLAHGQQQWLEIGMALASKPRLLLLDEPTAGMSVAERRTTAEFLVPHRVHCAILIVEHDLAFLRDICDVMTVLDQGRVLDSGTVPEIRASAKVQEAYLSRV